MNSIESIRKTIRIVESYQIPYALLHCTNVYPTPPELVRLDAVRTLQTEFPNAVVGLSDHTINNYTSLGAVSLGCSIIERHFTDSKDREGPDIVCSMDPTDLKNLIEGAKTLFLARGSHKGPIKEEDSCINFAFASVVSTITIKKGEMFSTGNIWVKRPGNGDFNSEDYSSLLGKICSKDIEPGKQIKNTDIE
jgi:N-acetylneuraminate synthase